MDLNALRRTLANLMPHDPEPEDEIQAELRGHRLLPPEMLKALIKKRAEFELDSPAARDKTAFLKIVCRFDRAWAFFVTDAGETDAGYNVGGFLLGHWDHVSRPDDHEDGEVSLVELDRCVWLADDPDEEPAFVPDGYRPETIAEVGFQGLDPALPYAYERVLDFEPKSVGEAVAEHERDVSRSDFDDR